METSLQPPAEVALDNFPWDDLLRLMQRTVLIPVIGSELYQHRDGDECNNYRLYTEVANQLVAACTESISQNNKLIESFKASESKSIFAKDRHYFHKAAEQFLSKDKQPDYLRLTEKIEESIRAINFAQAADILRLAQIDKFRIFINTTYDNFLYHALKRAGRRKVLVYNYTTNDKPIGKWREPEPDETIIFNIFGNFKNIRPAYTEKDIIESVAALQNDIQNINNPFFNKLTIDSYLFVGCSFKNWLLRFIIRSITKAPFDPIYSPQSRFFSSDIKPDDPDDADLQIFLRAHQSKIYSTGISQFMDAFWEKVQEKNKEENDWIIDLHSCFVSFDGKDRLWATELNQTLSREGIKTWFDSERDNSGNVVDDTIQSAICRSTTFLAIISKSYGQRTDGKPGYQQQEVYWLERHNKDERRNDPIKVKTLVIGNIDKGDLPPILNGNFWYEIPDVNMDDPKVKATIGKLVRDLKNDCQ